MPEQNPDDLSANRDGVGARATVDKTRTTTGTPLPASSGGPAGTRSSLSPRDSSRYQIVAEHGRGGLGRVLRAHDRDLARDVAIKEILSADGIAEARFIREAMITARLEHPGIVPVHDAGRWQDGTPFYAMKLVAGRPLKEVIREAHSLKDRLSLLPHVIAVAEAIAYSHSRSIIHRDLKPSNIIVGDFGETVVIDWGLAKDLNDASPSDPESSVVSSDPAVTRAGAVLGTPAYMPPEQAQGRDVSTAADIYALGAVLYHVLTGVPPHSSDSSAESRAPVPLTTRQPDVPGELSAIVAKAMRAEPSERYETAEQLVDDLRSYQTGQLVTAHRYGAAALLWRWTVRYRAPVAAFIVLVAAVVGLWIANRKIGEQEETARAAERVAQSSAASLRHSQLDQFLELGRLALLANDSQRALPYLSEVYSSGVRSKALDFLLASALEKLPVASIVHTDWVMNVDIASNGRLGISCGTDGVVQLWRADLPDAAPVLNRWNLGGKKIWDCHFSPDGSRVLAVGGGGEAAIFDTSDYRTLVRWKADEWVFASAWSPDGNLVATAGGSGNVRLWRSADGSQSADLVGGGGFLRGVVFSRRGNRVASWGYTSGTVKVWDLSAANRATPVAEGSPDALSATLSPDGAIVAIADASGQVGLWDTRTGRRIHVLEAPSIRMSAPEFSADGSQILTVGSDKAAYVWSSVDGRILKRFLGSAGVLVGGRFAPDGARLMTFGNDGWVHVYDASSATMIDAFHGDPGSIRAGAWRPDGARIVTASFDGYANLWDVGTHAPTMIATGATASINVRALPDAKRLLTVTTTVDLWNLLDGHHLMRVDGLRDVTCFDVAKDGNTAVFGEAAGGLAIVDLDRGIVVKRVDLPGKGPARSVSMSPDGSRAAVAHDRTSAIVSLAVSSAVTNLDPAMQELPEQLQFSPDGLSVAESTGNESVYIFDSHTGAVRTPPGRLLGPGVYYHPTRSVVAILDARGRNITQVIDATSGQTLVTMEGHTDRVSSVGFSPDGQFLVTTGADQTIRLWDGHTGSLLSTWTAPERLIGCGQFDATGTRMIACSIGGPTRVWNLPPAPPEPEVVATIVRCRVPYRLKDGQLIPAAPDACASPGTQQPGSSGTAPIPR